MDKNQELISIVYALEIQLSYQKADYDMLLEGNQQLIKKESQIAEDHHAAKLKLQAKYIKDLKMQIDILVLEINQRDLVLKNLADQLKQQQEYSQKLQTEILSCHLSNVRTPILCEISSEDAVDSRLSQLYLGREVNYSQRKILNQVRKSILPSKIALGQFRHHLQICSIDLAFEKFYRYLKQK